MIPFFYILNLNLQKQFLIYIHNYIIKVIAKFCINQLSINYIYKLFIYYVYFYIKTFNKQCFFCDRIFSSKHC